MPHGQCSSPGERSDTRGAAGTVPAYRYAHAGYVFSLIGGPVAMGLYAPVSRLMPPAIQLSTGSGVNSCSDTATTAATSV
jgi:hypothetical protein